MYQVAEELWIKVVEARLDDRRRLEKRYACRGHVFVASAVGAVYAELSLPKEQRGFTPAKVCSRLGLDINNLNSDYYVGLLGDEANVYYLEDVMKELERRGSGGQVPITPPSGTLFTTSTQPIAMQSPQTSANLIEKDDEVPAVVDEVPPTPEGQTDLSLDLGS